MFLILMILFNFVILQNATCLPLHPVLACLFSVSQAVGCVAAT